MYPQTLGDANDVRSGFGLPDNYMLPDSGLGGTPKRKKKKSVFARAVKTTGGNLRAARRATTANVKVVAPLVSVAAFIPGVNVVAAPFAVKAVADATRAVRTVQAARKRAAVVQQKISVASKAIQSRADRAKVQAATLAKKARAVAAAGDALGAGKITQQANKVAEMADRLSAQADSIAQTAQSAGVAAGGAVRGAVEGAADAVAADTVGPVAASLAKYPLVWAGFAALGLYAVTKGGGSSRRY